MIELSGVLSEAISLINATHSDEMGWLSLSQVQPALTETPLPFLWTQLVTALVVGLLTAFGFQLLLTNLGIVLGLSAVTQRLSRMRARAAIGGQEPPDDRPTSSSPIAPTLGLGMFLTVNSVLFAACFLGTRFSHVAKPMMGAIAGLSIWSAYLLILLWLSTRTLNSVAGLVFDQATGGLRWVVGAIADLVREDPAEPLSEEDIQAIIREEVHTALNRAEIQALLATPQPSFAPVTVINDGEADVVETDATESQRNHSPVWQPVKAYLTETTPKRLTSKQIHQKLEEIFHAVEAEQNSQTWIPFQKKKVQDWLDQRDDLSDKKKQRILLEVENSWNNFRPESESIPQPDLENHESHDDDASGSDESLREKLQSVLNKTIDSTLENLNLTESLPNTNVPISYVVGTALVSLAEILPQLAKSETLQDTIPLDLAEIKPTFEHLLEEARGNLSNLGQVSLQQVGQVRDLAIQPLSTLQARIQAKIDSFKQQTYEQVEAAQRRAIKALWWLFAIASTAAVSSTLAGVLATKI